MNDQAPHDWHDTLIDRSLAELIGGETPPDLTERILAAVEKKSEVYVTLTPDVETKKESTNSSAAKVWMTLAVAVSLCGVAVGLILPEVKSARETARQSENEQLPQPDSIHHSDKVDFDSLHQPQGALGLKGIINDWYAGKPASGSDAENAPAPPSPEQFPNLSVDETLIQASEGEKLQMMVEPHIIARDDSKGPTPATPATEELYSFSLGFARAKEQSAPAPEKRPRIRTLGRELSEVGERLSESSSVNNMPSPYYLSDDVQYYASGGEFGKGLKREYWGVQRFRHDAAPNERFSDSQAFSDAMRRIKANEQGSGPDTSGDQYTRIHENPFIKAVLGDAVSTFSIDVDTASYANVRQFLEQSRRLPPPDAVRIEELVNYFDYDYAGPTDDTPFAAHLEVAACPWKAEHRLARIGIKGREIDRQARPQSNLVFLIDVSGSMNEPNKLPLLIEGMKLLTRELGENDNVAIVVYASSEGLALPSTRGDRQHAILTALDRLQAGGSTAGGAGIQLAYKTAQENFIKGGVNRVILCTDGDFNVGVTSTSELERLAEERARETGVFLTVLGFGRGNLNDAMMEAISGKGNGNYHYVDNLTEARKVLVEEMSGTLVTIAKDVKIQVEFNPAKVAGYRLIGYENRMLRTEDFNDDKKDAGEIGAGHTVTALYEIIPAGKKVDTPAIDPLKYQPDESAKTPATAALRQGGDVKASDELLTLKLRYKLPDGDTSTKVEFALTDQGGAFEDASEDFRFATSVASFGMLLRNSEYCGTATYDTVLETASSASSRDPLGYRAEFLDLVRIANGLQQ